MRYVMLVAMMSALAAVRADEWRRVAFIGGAEAFSISGLVEVIDEGDVSMLHQKDQVNIGQTLRVWRGSEVILKMDRTKTLVRAKGPTLLRLASLSEGFDSASAGSSSNRRSDVFIVRAVRGHGKFQDGDCWRDLQAGMALPEGAKVRPYRNSVLDFYHTGTKTAVRVTDHKHQTVLTPISEGAAGTILAAKAP